MVLKNVPLVSPASCIRKVSSHSRGIIPLLDNDLLAPQIGDTVDAGLSSHQQNFLEESTSEDGCDESGNYVDDVPELQVLQGGNRQDIHFCRFNHLDDPLPAAQHLRLGAGEIFAAVILEDFVEPHFGCREGIVEVDVDEDLRRVAHA